MLIGVEDVARRQGWLTMAETGHSGLLERLAADHLGSNELTFVGRSRRGFLRDTTRTDGFHKGFKHALANLFPSCDEEIARDSRFLDSS